MRVTAGISAHELPMWEWVVTLRTVCARRPHAARVEQIVDIVTRAPDSRQAVANVLLGVVLEMDEHIARIDVNRLQMWPTTRDI